MSSQSPWVSQRKLDSSLLSSLKWKPIQRAIHYVFAFFSPLVSLFIVFPTFGAFQGETQLVLFVNFVHFAFKVILEHKTKTHLYQSTVATVIQHNSTKHPWHSMISICSSCHVYRGGGLTQSEGVRWGQIPAEAHGSLIFLLGPIDWACSWFCKQNHTRFLIASYQNQTLLSPMLFAIDQSRPHGETQRQTARRFLLLHLRGELQKHIVKGVDGGRGEEQGLLLQFIPSTALPVSFSWDFWNSEIPSLTFQLTVGILIQVSGYIYFMISFSYAEKGPPYAVNSIYSQSFAMLIVNVTL